MSRAPLNSYGSQINQILSKYRYPEVAKCDVYTAIRKYRTLKVKLDTYVFSDGKRQQLACLNGTIPVLFKGTFYHMPVCIWLLDTHPYESPICYVKPTSNMFLRPTRHVDTTGKVHLPYLDEWQPGDSDLLGVIEVMIIVFGESPPVYTRAKSPKSNPYTTPCATDPSNQLCTSRSSVDDHENKVLLDFKQLFLNKKDSDAMIRVKGQEFPVHRLILKTRSPVLASLFDNDVKAKATGILEIKESDPSSFSEFLCFLYCGRADITKENISSLFRMADKYDVKDLRAKCLKIVKKNLSVDTFCDVVNLALLNAETEVIELATDFFTDNESKIIATAKWQSFSAENPMCAKQLIAKSCSKRK